MNSVKDKFLKLQGVFILLAVLITAQMLILFLLQNNQSGNISAANELSEDYMSILAKENELFRKISLVKDTVSADNLLKLRGEFDVLRKELIAWGARGAEDLLISESLAEEELSRLIALQRALDMFSQNKNDEAEKILELEKRIFFDRAPVIQNILNRLIADTKQTSSFISIFFLVIIILNIPVFVILLLMTRQLYSSFRNDVSALTRIAQSIKKGEKYEVSDITSIKETGELLDAFKDMELELINRNMLTKEEATRTKKSNEKLEEKIERSSHEIVKANELLEKKNSELEQILYAASHDLRTPLIGVQGFSQELQYLCDMLKEEITKSGGVVEEGTKLQDILDKDIPNSVNYIINGSNKMDTMIQGLLRISRVGLEELQISEIDMNEFIRQIVDDLSFQAQSANAMIITNELENCFGDKEKLEQVFTNLIVNAIKYRKDDGSCEIIISCERDHDELRYIIADNGKGMSVESLNKIFNTFFRVDSDQGTGEGLGLTIANRIVEKHQGRLEVQSEEGKGSKFIIVIPQQMTTDAEDSENE